MPDNHIADAEASHSVKNVTPDLCRVGSVVVPFEISQQLSSKRSDYSPDVLARGGAVLKKGSVVGGTIGNAGQGVVSGVSGPNGHAIAFMGDRSVFVNGKPTVRNMDLFYMNTQSAALLQCIGRAQTGKDLRKVKVTAQSDEETMRIYALRSNITRAQDEFRDASKEVDASRIEVNDMLEKLNSVHREVVKSLEGAGVLVGAGGVVAAGPVALGLGAIGALLPFLSGDTQGGLMGLLRNTPDHVKNASTSLAQAAGMEKDLGVAAETFQKIGITPGVASAFSAGNMAIDAAGFVTNSTPDVAEALWDYTSKQLDKIEADIAQHVTTNLGYWEKQFGFAPDRPTLHAKITRMKNALKRQSDAAVALAKALDAAGLPPGIVIHPR